MLLVIGCPVSACFPFLCTASPTWRFLHSTHPGKIDNLEKSISCTHSQQNLRWHHWFYFLEYYILLLSHLCSECLLPPGRSETSRKCLLHHDSCTSSTRASKSPFWCGTQISHILCTLKIHTKFFLQSSARYPYPPNVINVNAPRDVIKVTDCV